MEISKFCQKKEKFPQCRTPHLVLFYIFFLNTSRNFLHNFPLLTASLTSFIHWWCSLKLLLSRFCLEWGGKMKSFWIFVHIFWASFSPPARENFPTSPLSETFDIRLEFHTQNWVWNLIAKLIFGSRGKFVICNLRKINFSFLGNF